MIPTYYFFDEIFDCLALRILDEICIGKSNIYYGRLKSTYNSYINYIKQYAFYDNILGMNFEDVLGLPTKGTLDLTILYKLVLNKLLSIDEILIIYEKNNQLDFFNENIKCNLEVVVNAFENYPSDYFGMYDYLKDNQYALLILYLNLDNKIRNKKFVEKNKDKMEEFWKLYEILHFNFIRVL